MNLEPETTIVVGEREVEMLRRSTCCRPVHLMKSMIFLFALASCTVPERPDRATLTFDPSQDEGVVIMGLYLKEQTWYYKPARPWAVTFYELEPEQGLLRDPDVDGRTIHLSRHIWDGEPVIINDVE
jgi:hypothetical protein